MLEVIKFSKKKPKLSILVQDWGVRENFQLLHYLREQNVESENIETIFVEYYDQINEKILKEYYDDVDTIIKLNFTKEYEYSKHLMFNVGIALSRANVFCICDSDAMIKKDFCKYIINFHESNSDAYLHIDQFRNHEKKYYPFNFPDIEKVIKNSKNFSNGKTLGILDDGDPQHARNHGACGSANINNLLKIYCADESDDFLGHICGNDDLSSRMMNAGMKKIWANDCYIAHTWHPNAEGQEIKIKNIDDFWGPHDGKGISLLIRNSILTGRRKPLVKNNFLKKFSSKKEYISLMEENVELFYKEIVNYDRYKSFRKSEIIKKTYKNKRIGLIDCDLSKFTSITDYIAYKRKPLVILKDVYFAFKAWLSKKYPILYFKLYSIKNKFKKIN